MNKYRSMKTFPLNRVPKRYFLDGTDIVHLQLSYEEKVIANAGCYDATFPTHYSTIRVTVH